jgi:hypothetical protein
VWKPDLCEEPAEVLGGPHTGGTYQDGPADAVEAAEDVVVLEISSDGGGGWTPLESFDSAAGVSSGSRRYDISSFASDNTQIRFRVAAAYGGPDEFFLVDNVEIGWADARVATAEDTTYVFNTADFGFSDVDASDSLAQIQVTSLETVGSLQLSGADVTLNQVISVADITAGNLTFTPAADQSRVAYDSFGFKVHDGTECSAAAYTMTVDVTPVNDPPTVTLQNMTTTFPEDTDTTARIKVADIVVADDALGTNVLSLSGTDAALFEIDGTELYLSAGASLDFETNPVLDVAVEVDDAALPATPEDSAALAIDVTDVNEAPTVTLQNTTTTFPEDTDTTARIKVADIVVADDALGTNVLSLSGTDAALFEIDGTELYLSAGVSLDFETTPVFDLAVTVTDAGGLADTKLVSISVERAEEPPVDDTTEIPPTDDDEDPTDDTDDTDSETTEEEGDTEDESARDSTTETNVPAEQGELPVGVPEQVAWNPAAFGSPGVDVPTSHANSSPAELSHEPHEVRRVSYDQAAHAAAAEGRFAMVRNQQMVQALDQIREEMAEDAALVEGEREMVVSSAEKGRWPSLPECSVFSCGAAHRRRLLSRRFRSGGGSIPWPSWRSLTRSAESARKSFARRERRRTSARRRSVGCSTRTTTLEPADSHPERLLSAVSGKPSVPAKSSAKARGSACR